MGKLTAKDLFEHMNKYKDTLFIVGNICLDFHASELDADILNNKTLRRDPEAFWNYYFENIYPITNKNCKAFDIVKKLIDKDSNNKIINLTFNDYFKKNCQCEQIDLHGIANEFKCTHCKTIIEKDKENLVCQQCNKPLRPNILLDGEKYFETEYQKMKQWLLETHTIIAIGVDWEETVIGDMLISFAESKDLFNMTHEDERKMIAIVGEDPLIPDMNDIGNFEFIVKGNVNESMTRLLESIN